MQNTESLYLYPVTEYSSVMPTVHLIIKGKVQGVFYRATAKKEADKLSLSGWVQNTGEGNVEIVASGTQPALQALTDWCRKGPSRAKVTDVVVTRKEGEELFDEFMIRR